MAQAFSAGPFDIYTGRDDRCSVICGVKMADMKRNIFNGNNWCIIHVHWFKNSQVGAGIPVYAKLTQMTWYS